MTSGPTFLLLFYPLYKVTIFNTLSGCEVIENVCSQCLKIMYSLKYSFFFFFQMIIFIYEFVYIFILTKKYFGGSMIG